MRLADIAGYAICVALFGGMIAAAFLLPKWMYRQRADVAQRLAVTLHGIGIQALPAPQFPTPVAGTFTARCDAMIGARPCTFVQSEGARSVPRTTSLYIPLRADHLAPGPAELSLICPRFQIVGMSLTMGRSAKTGDAAFDHEWFIYAPGPRSFELTAPFRAAMLAHARGMNVGFAGSYAGFSWATWDVTREQVAAAIAVTEAYVASARLAG